uniref:Uncharacterized protein n=1 Tax=Myoviridae sp. ctXVO17 TaxID=2825121 RepID=A0A8S5P1R5_9CAUD|nr:MAG TPA: hypothetical protein [Myoviridae sp. ctXVO17]
MYWALAGACKGSIEAVKRIVKRITYNGQKMKLQKK